MGAALRNLGIMVLGLALAVAILDELLGLKLEFLTASLVKQVGLLGVFSLGSGVLLSVLGGASSKVAGRRCQRCRKRVGKGQVYCADHLKRSIEELRDRDRSMEDTSFSRRGR